MGNFASKGRLYRIWHNMKTRCENPRGRGYADYGGRGITVCPEWRDSFEAFKKWAEKNGYKDDLTIDRIDNEGAYSPENCRWATMKEQSNNRRSAHLVTFGGKTRTVTEWAEKIGIRPGSLWWRLNAGWPVEKALTEPMNERRNGK